MMTSVIKQHSNTSWLYKYAQQTVTIM